MVPDVMKIFGGNEALVVQITQRSFNVEGMNTSQPNQSWISLYMTVWSLQVLRENAVLSGTWWQGVWAGICLNFLREDETQGV
jgi:hypothetical protein